MMELPAHIQTFEFGETTIQLYVPDEQVVKEQYAAGQKNGLQPLFPYWAKLWPSSLGLCRHIQSHPELVREKVVLELAAGLGLPSLLAATLAAKVICSDYVEEALPFISNAAVLNNINNVECRLIDWQHYPDGLQADIVLFSDINYDPAQFEILHGLIKSLLNRGTTVLLSTPQRIMAKPFIEKLLPYCKEKLTSHVETGRESAEIFIMQLKRG